MTGIYKYLLPELKLQTVYKKGILFQSAGTIQRVPGFIAVKMLN